MQYKKGRLLLTGSEKLIKSRRLLNYLDTFPTKMIAKTEFIVLLVEFEAKLLP